MELLDAWVRFATDGDPGWQRWDTTHPVRLFDAGPPRVEYGPRDAELALWNAAETLPPTEPTPVAVPPLPAPPRGTELRSVVRRLRLPGSVRRH